jgi:SAM-dependent methyltransferase
MNTPAIDAHDPTVRRHLDLLTLAEQPRVDDRLLLRSAEIMRGYARIYCAENKSAPAGNCGRYHGWWQYWRLAGLAATPDWHADYYRDLLQSTPGEREFRVLICGTADYGILEHLVRAIPPILRPWIRIAVLDLCRTPLKICSWYGSEYLGRPESELRLSCHRGDALLSPFRDEAFDLITTYGFLPRFTHDDKERVISEWRRNLKPGGRIVTTARLASSAMEEVVELDAAEFSRQVVWQMVADRPRLRSASDTIGRLAFDYAQTVVSHVIPSLGYAHELFDGFDSLVEIGTLDSRFEGSKSYVSIMATKR